MLTAFVINRNKANDAKAMKALKKGWKVITVWECKPRPVNIENILKDTLSSAPETMRTIIC
jgi:G:T-mismatch repair DNA endonuclease (very short patch repair protein)